MIPIFLINLETEVDHLTLPNAPLCALIAALHVHVSQMEADIARDLASLSALGAAVWDVFASTTPGLDAAQLRDNVILAAWGSYVFFNMRT